MHQVSLLKHALSTHFSPGTDIDITLLGLEHTMKEMFAAGPIKEDDWMIVICLDCKGNPTCALEYLIKLSWD